MSPINSGTVPDEANEVSVRALATALSAISPCYSGPLLIDFDLLDHPSPKIEFVADGKHRHKYCHRVILGQFNGWCRALRQVGFEPLRVAFVTTNCSVVADLPSLGANQAGSLVRMFREAIGDGSAPHVIILMELNSNLCVPVRVAICGIGHLSLEVQQELYIAVDTWFLQVAPWFSGVRRIGFLVDLEELELEDDEPGQIPSGSSRIVALPR
jgi:hypothetical protein